MWKPVVGAVALAAVAQAAVSDVTIIFEDGSQITTDLPIYGSAVPLYTVTEVAPLVAPGNGDDGGNEPEPKPEPTKDPELVAIEYCQNFDTSQGLTFAYVEWQRTCDTNKDGEYQFCEDWKYPGPITFSYVWWNRGCQDDPNFSPVKSDSTDD